MNKATTTAISLTPGPTAELLQGFRATHHTAQQVIHGHCWEYVNCGAGEAAVLVLPGGLAVSETAFRYILRFESHAQVIAPTYPPTIMTMVGLIDGLQGLLRALQVERVHVIGGSYSGLVAQCMVRRAPDCVHTLVLSDTGVPCIRRARQLEWGLKVLRRLPMRVVRWLLRRGVALFLHDMTTDRVFWQHYFAELINSMSRQACVSHLQIWIDFDRHYQFAPGDLGDWPGEILLIEAERDGLFQPLEQHRLKQLYPTAQVYTFHGSAHSASLERMDEYISVIECFLDQRLSYE